MKTKPKIETLKNELKILEVYLDMKRKQRDWHGVADAAMDIRELEAILKEKHKK